MYWLPRMSERQVSKILRLGFPDPVRGLFLGWRKIASAIFRNSGFDCKNMSGHALIGRPAARLETMALAFSLYVIVCIV